MLRLVSATASSSIVLRRAGAAVDRQARFYNDIPIPFGKHKGSKLSEIPVDYLEWCLSRRVFNKKNPELLAGSEELVKAAGRTVTYHVWKMPFGKHKGQNVNDVPRDYLEWCLKKGLFRNFDLAKAVEERVLELGGCIVPNYNNQPSQRRDIQSLVVLPSNNVSMLQATDELLPTAIKGVASSDPQHGLRDMFVSGWDADLAKDLIQLIERDGKTLKTVSLMPTEWTKPALLVLEAIVKHAKDLKNIVLKIGKIDEESEAPQKIGELLRGLPSDFNDACFLECSQDDLLSILWEFSVADVELTWRPKSITVMTDDNIVADLGESPGMTKIMGGKVKATRSHPKATKKYVSFEPLVSREQDVKIAPAEKAEGKQDA